MSRTGYTGEDGFEIYAAPGTIVDMQIVDCSAVLVGHHAVEHLPVGHGCGVVGEYMVEHFDRLNPYTYQWKTI